jgi:putative flippase GtrA
MDQHSNFKRKDLIAALIIGEISAWLIVILAESLLPHGASTKTVLGFGSRSLSRTLPIVFPIILAGYLYMAFLFSKRVAVVYQITKFVLVGGLNTLVDWGILALLSRITLNVFSIAPSDLLFGVFSIGITYYVLFKTISFAISVCNSYPWNKFWTFGEKVNERAGKEFLQFFTISLTSLFINVGVAAFIFQTFSYVPLLTETRWEILAAGVGTVVSMTWNFLGYKFIVFTRKPKAQSSAVRTIGRSVLLYKIFSR